MMHDKLIKAGWSFYADESKISFPYANGFYQKRMFSYEVSNDVENISANLVRYDEIPQFEKGITYELEVYLPDDFSLANEATIVKTYSYKEEELDLEKIEKLAKEIIRRLRKP